MPNWCKNYLKVKGNDNDVEAFVEFCKTKDEGNTWWYTDLDFKNFIPIPEDIIEAMNKVERSMKINATKEEKELSVEVIAKCNSNRDWALEHWGTDRLPQISLGSVKIERIERMEIDPKTHRGKWTYKGESEASFEFATAYTPPLKVIEEMGKRFSKLCFRETYFRRTSMKYDPYGLNGLFIVEKAEVVTNETAPYFGDEGE